MELISTSGIPDKGGDAVQRGITIANALVKMVGLNLLQACAFVGYCMKESSCNPASYNKSEAAGTAKSKALGADCGEGIMQWSFVNTKNKARASIGLPPASYPGGIINLSMDQQIQMMIKSSFMQTALKHGLKSATSWEPAVCCATIQGHGIKHAIDCYEAAGGNINSETYVRACLSKYNGRQDLQRAKKWAQQVFAAMGGRPGDYEGGMSGGGSHEWPDFNVKPYPIFVDEKGKYTNEPILMGIVNHLRIEGSPGAEESLNTGDMGGELSVNGGKFSGSVSVNVVNPNVYNIVLYRYNKCSSGAGDGHTAVEGVIFEYSTKDIITYTIEDETDIRNTGFGLKFKNPYKVIPSGHGWCNSAPHHRGCSQYTVYLSHGQGGFGSSTGAYNTMLATDHKPGCLFHPGASTTWSEGCILCGQKATNGKRSMQASDFYPDTIMHSNAEAVKWYKNFYNKIVPKICSGTTVHLYVTGVIAPG